MFFENFNELEQFFFESVNMMPKKVSINNRQYTLVVNDVSINKLFESKELLSVYISDQDTIGMKWTLCENTLKPIIITEISDMIYSTICENTQQVIGDTVEVIFSYFSNAKPIRGKVDTGADVCSLHVSKWNTSNNRVSFIAPHLSNNTITANLYDNQAVKSADGGVEYRPVVEFDITINGKELKKVIFNLNDRSQMDSPVLIGQNALEQGKFLVNPSANESIDWNTIHNILK